MTKKVLDEAVNDSETGKIEVDENIPVTKPDVKCIFVSDGIYKYVDADGNDVI